VKTEDLEVAEALGIVLPIQNQVVREILLM
jgi:hypothetical protein